MNYFLTLVLQTSLLVALQSGLAFAKPHGDKALELPQVIHHEDDLIDPIGNRKLTSEELTVEGGYITGKYLKEGGRNSYLVGVRYQWMKSADRANDLGFRVTDKTVGLDANYRMYCCLGDYYEPYWSLGVGSVYTAEDGLANFVDIRKYHLKITAGFENILNQRRNIRAAVEVYSAVQGTAAAAVFGYKF